MTGMMPTGIELADLATPGTCPDCGCPTDGVVHELAAWEHEPRDRFGRWTDSPGGMGSPVSGEPKSKADLARKLDGMLKRSHGPEVIVPLVNASSSLEADDWQRALQHLYEAADAADARMKPGTKSRAGTSYRLLGDMIEEHYTETSTLNTRMAAVNRGPAQEVPYWLGGGQERWDGQDVFIFDQNTDKSVAASMGWHGEFRMSDDTAREVRKALDSAGPIDTGSIDTTAALSVSLHELIHGVEAPIVTPHSLSGLSGRDDQILQSMDRLAFNDLPRIRRMTIKDINTRRMPGDPTITREELDALVDRGYLGRDDILFGPQEPLYTLTPQWYRDRVGIEDSDTEQHKQAYKRYGVSRVEEGFTELGTVYHMPQWLESVGLADRPTTEVSAADPDAIEAKFNIKAAYDQQQLFHDLEREAGQLGGRPGTMDGYMALGNAKYAFYRDPTDKVEITSQLARAASAYERADFPEMRSKIINFMHELGVGPSDVRALTMREYAERIASYPSRVADNTAWKHYAWETKAAQTWVKFIARFEGLDPDYPGGPGVRRSAELADEINREGPAGKIPAMARQIMRAKGVPADARMTATRTVQQALEGTIEQTWPDDERKDNRVPIQAAQEDIATWREYGSGHGEG